MPANNYIAHADNMKRALRNAASRCEAAGRMGEEVTIYDTGLVPSKPPRSNIVRQTSLAIDLNVDGVVFLTELMQFGVPYEAAEGYIPLTARKLAAGLTEGVHNEDEAYDILEPYFRAILNLP